MFKKYSRNKKGAIALETALLLPILALGLIAALDVGYAVFYKQNMAKTTKAGVQYVVNGGRSKSETVNIMNSVTSHKVLDTDVSMKAYCGCISKESSGSGEPNENEEVETYSYAKSGAELSDDICPAPCDDGQQASALIELIYSKDVRGIVQTRELTSRLQVRVQ